MHYREDAYRMAYEIRAPNHRLTPELLQHLEVAADYVTRYPPICLSVYHMATQELHAIPDHDVYVNTREMTYCQCVFGVLQGCCRRGALDKPPVREGSGCPSLGAAQSGSWAMLPQRDGAGRVSQTARPFIVLPLGRRRRGRRERAWSVQTCYASVDESGPAWGVQTCYADGAPLEAGVGSPPGRRRRCGDGCGVGLPRGFSPPAGHPWGVQTCYAGGAPLEAGVGSPPEGERRCGDGCGVGLPRGFPAPAGRPWGVQTCYAGGAPLEAGVGSPPEGERRCGDGCGVGLPRGFPAPAGRPWGRIAAAQGHSAR